MTEPKIKGCITRAIETLEDAVFLTEVCELEEAEFKSGWRDMYDTKDIFKQALVDLKAFKEALPDGLIDAMEYYEQMHEMELENTPYGAMLKAAKLTAEAINDD